MAKNPRGLDSVCVYCASSNNVAPAFIAAAEAFGAILAGEGLRLIYGGGSVGLMGAVARAAHDAGGRVRGVIPDFLTSHERPLAQVDTVVVHTMHERKMMMFQEADAFAILPGGIGTLEELIELLSWRRLGLHSKPIGFLNIDGFWDPLFTLFRHILDQRLVPPEFSQTWVSVERVDELLPAMRAMPTTVFSGPPSLEEMTTPPSHGAG